MKTIAFSILLVFLVLLAAMVLKWGENAVEIAQAQSVIEAARAAQDAARAAQVASQGLSDVARGQTLILLFLALIAALIIGMGVYIAIRRQMWKRLPVQPEVTGRWVSGPNAHWKRLGTPDAYQQILLQQQMVITQLLEQRQAEKDEDDPPQLPAGWWG